MNHQTINESVHWQDNGKPCDINIDSKKWGLEHIISRDPHGCKIMEVYPTAQCSLHFHAHKTETFILISGQLRIQTTTKDGTEQYTILTKPLSSITIRPFTPHTFYVLSEEAAIFIEASTMDNPDDSYRIYPSRGRVQPT